MWRLCIIHYTASILLPIILPNLKMATNFCYFFTVTTCYLGWNVEFNPSECQVIHVIKRNPIPTQYFLHGVQLELFTSTNYLSMDIENYRLVPLLQDLP